MRVKYIINNNKEEALTYQKEYLVLTLEVFPSSSAIAMHEGDNIFFRLENDIGQMLMYPSKLFEITSNKVSSRWEIEKNHDGSIHFLPSLWRGAFIDEYYNYTPSAMEVYKNVKEKLFEEETY
ncbi:hypothetical protein LCL95_16050 [Bacillus timonensis]|nr:hypothetical protein [Bacillus timonensis]